MSRPEIHTKPNALSPAMETAIEAKIDSYLQSRPEDEAMLSAKQLAERFGNTLPTIYRWIAEHGFPKPLKFARTSRWKLSEVKAWEAEQEKARDTAEA